MTGDSMRRWRVVTSRTSGPMPGGPLRNPRDDLGWPDVRDDTPLAALLLTLDMPGAYDVAAHPDGEGMVTWHDPHLPAAEAPTGEPLTVRWIIYAPRWAEAMTHWPDGTPLYVGIVAP